MDEFLLFTHMDFFIQNQKVAFDDFNPIFPEK